LRKEEEGRKSCSWGSRVARAKGAIRGKCRPQKALRRETISLREARKKKKKKRGIMEKLLHMKLDRRGSLRDGMSDLKVFKDERRQQGEKGGRARHKRKKRSQ